MKIEYIQPKEPLYLPLYIVQKGNVVAFPTEDSDGRPYLVLGSDTIIDSQGDFIKVVDLITDEVGMMPVESFTRILKAKLVIEDE